MTLRYIDIFCNLLAIGGFSPRLWRVIRDESFSIAASYEDDEKFCDLPLSTTLLLPLSKRTSDTNPKTSNHNSFQKLNFNLSI